MIFLLVAYIKMKSLKMRVFHFQTNKLFLALTNKVVLIYLRSFAMQTSIKIITPDHYYQR